MRAPTINIDRNVCFCRVERWAETDEKRAFVRNCLHACGTWSTEWAEDSDSRDACKALWCSRAAERRKRSIIEAP